MATTSSRTAPPFFSPPTTRPRARGRRGALGRKSYSLTEEGFGLLLRVLGTDAEAQGRRYEEIRQRLMVFFSYRGCEAPEELADEVFDRVAQRLCEGVRIDTANPFSYFHGVAFLLYREHLRREKIAKQSLQSQYFPTFTPPAPLAVMDETERRLYRLRQGLAHIGADERDLILAYYAGEDRIRSRQQLSEMLGIPANALRIRVFRVRRKLEQELEKNGFFGPNAARAGRRERVAW